MTTNTNAAPTTPVSSDVQEKLDFNEYQLECAADGTKAKTFHQWKNQGKIATPGLIATATGTAKVATNNGAIPKSLIARQVFARHAATGSLVRKNIILDFISEAFLTPAGAATYYANIGSVYKKDPQAFMDANYVVPVVDDELSDNIATALSTTLTDTVEDVELEQIEEEVASLLATDALEDEVDDALEEKLADEFDTLAANDEADAEEDAA